MKIPTYKVVNGEGKPRLILAESDKLYQSTGTTTYDSASVTEAEGSAITITSSSVANPTLITTATNHGRAIGDWIRIAGHTGSTPDINGKHQILDVPAATTIKIGVNVTVGGTGGTLRRTPAFSGRGFSVGRRVFVPGDPTTSQDDKYGKITAIDDANNKLTVDEWKGGTPVNGLQFQVDGWVIDLPYCKELTERFEPKILIHNLWKFRKKTKFYGYDYTCIMDFSELIMGDTLIDLNPILNAKEDDDIVLVPRVDKYSIQYNAFIGDSISLSMIGKGKGHRKPVFVFRGKELVDFPSIVSGYGVNYGNSYGTGL